MTRIVPAPERTPMHEQEKRLRLGVALLKSVVSEHTEPWETCRHCLAVERLDTHSGHAEMRAVLAALSAASPKEPEVKRTGVVHELKDWPEYFEPLARGLKTFEIRRNDRQFKVGDEVRLIEKELGSDPTGREARFVISYLTDFQQQSGYVVLGLQSVPGVPPFAPPGKVE